MTPMDGGYLHDPDPRAPLRAAIAACPADGNLQLVLAQTLLTDGRHGEARAALAEAARLGTASEPFDLMALAAYPGPRYLDHLEALHDALAPATYLEIGVFMGESLARARPGTRAIAVDPEPLAGSARPYAAETTIHRLRSDAYFEAVAAGSLPSPDPVDLAFIDGLHVFEQVLRDFINVERQCHRGSVVVLHDTLPVCPAVAARTRATRHWCGDTWKVLPCLRALRPDLRLLTIPTYPSGLTLVTGLDRHSTVLDETYDRAVAMFVGAELPHASRVSDIANDFLAIGDWLAAAMEDFGV